MKLSEIRDAYESLSGKLSDIVRQLSFAGIGIIWIFRVSNSENSILISKELYWPLLWLVITLILDALQYLISSLIWYFVYCKYKKDNKNNDDGKVIVKEKERWNIASWVFWLLKTITLSIAFVYLACYLVDKL